MFTIIKNLPEDILGVVISGETTKEDYENIQPLFEEHKKMNDDFKMFVEIDEFKYSAGALWEDFKTSFKYLGSISAMAVVTDKEWLEESMEAFGAIMPGLKTEGFDLDKRDKALQWLKKQ